MNDVVISPIKLVLLAQEFYVAGSAALNAAGNKVSLPAYFLFGHSVELSLKAFLMAKGIGIAHLKGKFGHDLSAMLGESQKNGLATVIKLEDREAGTIELLACDYMTKRLEYPLVEINYLPFSDIAQNVARKMAFQLEPFCQDTYPISKPTS